jgi:hypothetical protein
MFLSAANHTANTNNALMSINCHSFMAPGLKAGPNKVIEKARIAVDHVSPVARR